MALVLVDLCCRADNAGVTSLVRVLNFSGQACHRFLHLFHNTSLDLDLLTSCWVRLCLVLFCPFEVDSRLVCLADGIKALKEGRRMPGVKLLHQQSAINTKPEYIMGHSLQAISLLVHSGSARVAAVPLTSRVYEGLVFFNRDARTLLDKLVALLFSIARAGDRKVLLVADAYYASGKVITPLLANGHQLLTRAKSNAVAYLPVPQSKHRGKGQPKIYGEEVRLKDLAQDDSAFIRAPSPVYGKRDVTVRYRVLDLMWRPVGRIVRFCVVYHPVRGTIFLLSTDTAPNLWRCLNSTATDSRSSWVFAKPSAASCMPTTFMFSSDASLRGHCSTCPSITPLRFGAAFAVADFAPDLAKIMIKYRKHEPSPDTERMMT